MSSYASLQTDCAPRSEPPILWLIEAATSSEAGTTSSAQPHFRAASPPPREKPHNPLMNCYCAGDGKWFWLVGAVMVSILPTLVKDTLGGEEFAVVLPHTDMAGAMKAALWHRRIRT